MDNRNFHGRQLNFNLFFFLLVYEVLESTTFNVVFVTNACEVSIFEMRENNFSRQLSKDRQSWQIIF